MMMMITFHDPFAVFPRHRTKLFRCVIIDSSQPFFEVYGVILALMRSRFREVNDCPRSHSQGVAESGPEPGPADPGACAPPPAGGRASCHSVGGRGQRCSPVAPGSGTSGEVLFPARGLFPGRSVAVARTTELC